MKSKKGMEMTIGIIFTIVVLVIVSGILLAVFYKTIIIPKPNPGSTNLQEIENAKRECMQVCELSDYESGNSINSIVEFCSKTEKIDWNGDGLYNGILDYGAILSCEDKVPCFVLYDCKDLNGFKCKEYLKKYADYKYARLEYANKTGDCGLDDKSQNNWILKYGFYKGAK
ncbi:MAG: hypothetical protein ACP5OZ_00955 [Candidatus Woesearchaeota archaeon]